MNLLQSAFSQALGWSLIDSLWQMGSIWLFYCVVTANGKRFSASHRHNLALIGIAAGTLWFLISLGLNYYRVANNYDLYSIAYVLNKHSGEGLLAEVLTEKTVSFLSLVYLPAVLFFALKFIFQIVTSTSFPGHRVAPPGNVIDDFVTRFTNSIGITRKVTVWLSSNVQSPLTIGFWKPVIIMPLAVFSQLSCRQVEAVLAHELFHIKRNDYLLNIFLTFSEVLLFFNPFARMLSSIVKKERENSCDDKVVCSGFNVWEYSEALYMLGRLSYRQNDVAIAATGLGKKYLLQRIRRLMNRKNPSPSVLKPFIAFFLCLVVAGLSVRNVKVAEPPTIKPPSDPAVYVLHQSHVVIEKTTAPEVNTPGPKKSFRDKKIVAKIPDKAPELMAEEVEDIIEIDDESPDIIFVTDPDIIEFTIIDQVAPSVPDPVVCETPQPYVPRNSFYFTEIDTVAGKKVIKI